jgi:very-short-patch-repair endonuclease
MRTINKTLKTARQLRKHMSLPEVMLWQRLRGRGEGKPVFRRQQPIGPYVLDFFCARTRLCVEIDGWSHGFGGRAQQDHRRDVFLLDQGIRTIRLAAHEVMRDPDAVATQVLDLAGRSAPSTAPRSPSPAPLGAGEEPR